MEAAPINPVAIDEEVMQLTFPSAGSASAPAPAKAPAWLQPVGASPAADQAEAAPGPAAIVLPPVIITGHRMTAEQIAAFDAEQRKANTPSWLEDYSASMKADAVFKFAAGGLATAGAGKVVGELGDFALDAAGTTLTVSGRAAGVVGGVALDTTKVALSTTAEWVAPKAGQTLENYMARSGGLLRGVEEGAGGNGAVAGELRAAAGGTAGVLRRLMGQVAKFRAPLRS